jgi:uncharacterized coiled-coil protein SlyX
VFQRCLNQCRRLEHRKSRAASAVTVAAKAIAEAQAALDKAKADLRSVAKELVQANIDRDDAANDLRAKPKSSPPADSLQGMVDQAFTSAQEAGEFGMLLGADWEQAYKGYAEDS